MWHLGLQRYLLKNNINRNKSMLITDTICPDRTFIDRSPNVLLIRYYFQHW